MSGLHAIPAIPVEPARGDDASPVRCMQCEYSLRGLERGGNCPECGSPIERSWRRHELELAQGWTPLALAAPSFLRRMGWGCTLVLVSAGISLVSGVLVVTNSPPRGPSPVMMLLFLASMGTTVVGLWLLGSREPSAQRPRAALLIRAGAVFVIAQSLLPAFIGKFIGVLSRMWTVQAILFTLLLAVVTWAVHGRLADLLRRSDAAVAWRRIAKLLARVFPALMIVQILLFPTIDISPSAAWMISSRPVAGPLFAAVLLPYSLITWPRLDPLHLFWLVMLTLSLSALLVLIRCARLFFALANRKEF